MLSLWLVASSYGFVSLSLMMALTRVKQVPVLIHIIAGCLVGALSAYTIDLPETLLPSVEIVVLSVFCFVVGFRLDLAGVLSNQRKGLLFFFIHLLCLSALFFGLAAWFDVKRSFGALFGFACAFMSGAAIMGHLVNHKLDKTLFGKRLLGFETIQSAFFGLALIGFCCFVGGSAEGLVLLSKLLGERSVEPLISGGSIITISLTTSAGLMWWFKRSSTIKWQALQNVIPPLNGLLLFGVVGGLLGIGLLWPMSAFLLGWLARALFQNENTNLHKNLGSWTIGALACLIAWLADWHFILTNSQWVLALVVAILSVKLIAGILWMKWLKPAATTKGATGLMLMTGSEVGCCLLYLGGVYGLLPFQVALLLCITLLLSMSLNSLVPLMMKPLQQQETTVPDSEMTERVKATNIEGKAVVILGDDYYAEVLSEFIAYCGFKPVLYWLGENSPRVDVSATLPADAMSLQSLERQGVLNCSSMVLAMHNGQLQDALMAALRQQTPNLELLCRSGSLSHSQTQLEQGVKIALPDACFSALELGKEVIKTQGVHAFKAAKLKDSYLADSK